MGPRAPPVLFCSHCGKAVGEGATFCTHCGHTMSTAFYGDAPQTLAPPSQATWGAAPAPVVTTHTQTQARTGPTQGMAIAGLLLNLLIWPGLGSIIAGDNVGWGQGFLCLGGLILTITVIGAIAGIPMMIGAWIWALVTSIGHVQRAA